MGTIFLIVALLKGLYSLLIATINCKDLFNKTAKLSDASNEKLSALIKYRATLLSIEVFGTCAMLIPLILGVKNMRYMIFGFAIWFVTGAIEDFTEILTCRWEQKRRQKPFP
jgi:hypothetical protein